MTAAHDFIRRQMVDLCYWYHVRNACRYGKKCDFVHETVFDPNTEYFTCTRTQRRKVTSPASFFSRPIPPAPKTIPPPPQFGHVVVISYKMFIKEHDGYCSWPEDEYSYDIEYGCVRRYNATGKTDEEFARSELTFNALGHDKEWCDCGGTYEIMDVFRGLEIRPKPCTITDQVISLPLPADLVVLVRDYLYDPATGLRVRW